MKRLLQCEEWSKLRIGRGLDLENLQDLTSILQAWRQKTGTDPSIYFDVRADSISPRFWSGSIETVKLRLEVAPVGTALLNAEQRRLLDTNLSGMLAYATSSQSSNAGRAMLSGDGQRYEALVEVFCDDLQIARRRQVLRRYITARDSLPSPRGRISFPGQCYETIRRPGRFSSEWIALTEDIAENRIFKDVLVRYRPRCSSRLRAKIDACLAELDSVQNDRDVELEWSRINKGRLPRIYQSLLDLSKVLLNGEAVGLFSGETIATSQIVFTSRLFEGYITKVLSALAAEIGLHTLAQERGTFLCQSEKQGNAFEVIPDVRLTHNSGKTALIIDAKWKYLSQGTKSFGISREDVYQILIYAAKFECTDVVLMYPDISNATGAVGFSSTFASRLAGVDYSIHIAKVPLLGTDISASRTFLKEFLHTFKTAN